MKTSSSDINFLVREIKKRWKFRAVKQGIAIILLTLLFFVVFIVILNFRFDLSPTFQRISLVITILVILFETFQFIIRPLLQKLSYQKIALFIEEKIPELEDRINSAVEIGDHSDQKEKTILIDKLIDDATQRTERLEFSSVVDLKKERILSYSAYGLLLLFFVFLYTFKDDVSFLTSKIDFNFKSAMEFMHIIPGNIQIEKGESQEIVAQMNKDIYDNILLHFKIGDEIWRKEIMEKAPDKSMYMYPIINIQQPTRYYIDVDGKRSSEYMISIYEFPRVDQIDLEYSYPSYTGIPDRVEENTGNIRGLKGSNVKLTITTSGTAISGELIVNDSLSLPLTAQSEGKFNGNLELRQQGVYYLKLTDKKGQNNKFPEIFRITAVDDELPVITITDPQRDVRVNAVEEVLIAASVTDDFGISNVQLKYSVNGNEEQSANLYKKNKQKIKDASGSHVLYLEDFGLEPGDIISYYVKADDYFQHPDPAVTDMYFIEIIPFDVNYTQVNNQSSGQPMQRQGSGMVINQQMIISATWKLIRTKKSMLPADVEQSIDALIRAQVNLRDNISDRVNSTAFSLEMALDEENKEIADLLRAAVKEMGLVVQSLSKNQLSEALKPEQKALNYLLKAEAKNRDKRVQQGRQAGWGRSSPSEERMTELMDLELDISKDKYEIQQENQQQQNEEVDDALQKVKDLAKKQQSLANRSRNNLQQEEDRRSIDRLKRDQEQLRQETEDLSRMMRQMSGNNQQISRQLREQIEKITETMRQAEQELTRNNVQQSISKQRQAINELNKLQQNMQLSSSDNAREMLDNFTKKFEQFKNQERQLAQDLNDTIDKVKENNGKLADKNTLKNIVEKRKNMINDLEDIKNQAKMIEEQTVQENPLTSTNMRNVQNAIKREDLEKKMGESQNLLEYGYLSYAKMLEDYILYSMNALEDQVRKLEGELPVTEEEKLTRSLEDTREMLRNFEEAMAKAQEDAQENNRNSNQQSARQGEPNDRDSETPRTAQEQQRSGDGSRTSSNNTLRMQRLNEQYQRMIERLQNDFQGDNDMRQTLESARHSAVSQNTGELLGEDGEEYFKQNIFDPLSQLEVQLLERLDAIELGKKLHVTNKAEVPAEYRRMVEKYFESISKTK